MSNRFEDMKSSSAKMIKQKQREMNKGEEKEKMQHLREYETCEERRTIIESRKNQKSERILQNAVERKSMCDETRYIIISQGKENE